MKKFEDVQLGVSFFEREEETLKNWKENKTFEKSVDSKPKSKSWNFLDGPPFVTGMPHYGSLLSSIPKDLYARYWTMKGYRVERVWGWDGHGLPIENKVENKLELKRKKDIEEKVGVKKFIEECFSYVDKVSAEWEWYIDHIGRWVDFKNAYKTWGKDYMESVMWVFKTLHNKGKIYKGRRVSLFCPHCVTPISNFEVAMDADNYKEITEKANTYKYKLKDSENTYFLAWSTTPWNKIATPALAVNPNLKYVKVKQENEFYVLAKNTIKNLKDSPKYEIVEEFSGKELLGKEFEPHYKFYKIDEGKKAFVIIAGDFVTEEDGTGIVTIAAYGEDDLKAMQENNIQIVLHVNEEGFLNSDVPNWAGMYYLDVNPLVNKDLEDRGLMYKEDNLTHSVPNCWRCHTRLYYAPQDAWYVDIQSMKDYLIEQNEHVNWYPSHFKEGRFLNSVKSAPDWCISRSRYWGSPVPVWETPSGKRFVPGSIKELEELSGMKVDDLHKPGIDEITIKDPETGEIAKRVPEVLDSWIEAGSAVFAERHYPFREANLNEFFPPDFISEYTGQIRAWFYVMHVINASLDLNENKKDNILAKNVLVSGVVNGTDGQKMSKNLGNYPDPKEMLQKYGGDALRLYLMGSPVMNGEDISISEEEYRNQVKGFLLPLWNTYRFFVTYANLNDWQPKNFVGELEAIDKWIDSRLNSLIKNVTECLEKYDSPKAIELLRSFLINDLSGWYIRRTRDRKDESSFYMQHNVLKNFALLLAPIAPFVSESIYKNLTGEDSVHLAAWPETRLENIDLSLEEEMDKARKIVETAHAIRKEKQIKVRQPLSKLTINEKLSVGVKELIADEVNVLEIVEGKEIDFDTEITEELRFMGEAREWVRNIQAERKNLGTELNEYINVVIPIDLPEKYLEIIKKGALVKEISFGDSLQINRLEK